MSDNPQPYGRRDENAGRVDLFNPNTLTPEESDLLRKLRFEASWKHGYPMALITGGVIAILTRKMTPVRRFAFTAAGVVTGNIVGKISFVPTIQQRILTDLPESSPLRQKVEEIREKGAKGLAGLSQLKDLETIDDHDLQFDTGSEYESHNMEPESDVDAPKKYTSYSELRKKHRDKAHTPSTSETFGILDHGPVAPVRESNTEVETQVVETQSAETSPKQKIRYNKYGDPIIE